MNFGDQFRKTRTRRGLTQTQLATLTGLKPSAISHFESGRRDPSLSNLIKLAEALSVTIDQLLGRIRDSGQKSEGK